MTKREQREQATFDVCGLRKTERERERRQRHCRFAVALTFCISATKQAVKVLSSMKQGHVCVYTRRNVWSKCRRIQCIDPCHIRNLTSTMLTKNKTFVNTRKKDTLRINNIKYYAACANYHDVVRSPPPRKKKVRVNESPPSFKLIKNPANENDSLQETVGILVTSKKKTPPMFNVNESHNLSSFRENRDRHSSFPTTQREREIGEERTSNK